LSSPWHMIIPIMRVVEAPRWSSGAAARRRRRGSRSAREVLAQLWLVPIWGRDRRPSWPRGHGVDRADEALAGRRPTPSWTGIASSPTMKSA
jgi:hypothetical protein